MRLINITPALVSGTYGGYTPSAPACIDSGDNSANSEPLDIGGNARIIGDDIDMGAIEVE
jgi:hypothetical protein